MLNTMRAFCFGMLRQLARMRTAILLLALCALVSVAGTFVVQGLPPQDYLAEHGVFWTDIILFTGLNDYVHAPWFLALWALLLLSVSMCLYQQTRGRVRRLKVRNIGYLALHYGILILAVGALVTGIWGWRGTLNLRLDEPDNIVLEFNGNDVEPHHLPFTVTATDFEVQRYQDGQPRQYQTMLEAAGNVQPLAVNHPVSVGSYTFYQASFGDAGSLVDLTLYRMQGPDVAAALAAGGQRWQGEVYGQHRFAGDVLLDVIDGHSWVPETGGPAVDMRLRTPTTEAVQVRFYQGRPLLVGVPAGPDAFGEMQYDAFSLRAPVHREQIQALNLPGWVVVEDIDNRHYTGLLVSYDPGFYIFWAGALLALLGIIILLTRAKKV